MLYVFGINPSTATESRPDPTMRKIIGFAIRNGFEGFAMMNLYPLRSTNPYEEKTFWEKNIINQYGNQNHGSVYSQTLLNIY